MQSLDLSLLLSYFGECALCSDPPFGRVYVLTEVLIALCRFNLELLDPEDAGWMDTKIFGLVAEKRPLMVHLRPVTT